MEYLRFEFEIPVKIFPGKIRIEIRPNLESYGILDSRFGYVTLQCVTTIIIKLYRWGAQPFVFSKTICVILSFFVFPITVLSNMIEFFDKLATEFSIAGHNPACYNK